MSWFRVVPDKSGAVTIGRYKEQLVREVAFPLPPLGEGGRYQANFQRPHAEAPYPLASRVEGQTLIWLVSLADTSDPGEGLVEIRWDGPNGETWKSPQYAVRIAKGLADPKEAPEAWAGFLQQVNQDAGRAESAADRAEALEAGYTEALEKARAAAEDAWNGYQSADKAAKEAKADAQRAETAASTATQAAQAATDAAASATEAARSAGSSAGQAGQAAQSAQAAALAAAQNAAAAETAEEAAKQAKTEAEAAQTKAEEAAQGVAADREQIGANKSGLEAAQQELAATKEQLDETKATLATTQDELKKAQRAIKFQAELNKGQTWDFEEDDQEAYQRQVPSGAKAGAVMEWGGKTRRGKNVLPLVLSKSEQNSFSQVSGATISVKNTAATNCYPQTEWFELPAGTYCAVQSDKNIETYLQLASGDYSHILKGNGYSVFTLDAATPVRLMLSIGAGINISVAIQTVRGSTPDYDFEPYTPELVSALVDEVLVANAAGNSTATHPIPAAVRSLPGYGWSAGSVANTVERTENGWQYVQRVGSVDLGTLRWSPQKISIDAYRYQITLPLMLSNTKNIVTAAYSYVGGGTWTGEIGIGTYYSIIQIFDSAYSDGTAESLAAFKAHVTGVPLYYELATPITTDITALMGDALAPFAVEAGGSITLHHPKADEGFTLDVPGKIQYITKLSEVSANG